MNPYVAAGRGMIDDVIDPGGDAAQRIARALEMLANKRETRSPPRSTEAYPL